MKLVFKLWVLSAKIRGVFWQAVLCYGNHPWQKDYHNLSISEWAIKLIPLLSFLAFYYPLGCGGNSNESFGTINIFKPDDGDLQCNWTIGSAGISNAVLLLSMEELHFEYCWR